MILLIHGWGGRSLQLHKFITPLNQLGYEVWAIDGPGHSSLTGRRTHFSQYAQALIKLVKAHPQIHGAVAHSFGGACCLYGLQNQMFLKQLVLLGSPSEFRFIANNFLTRMKIAPKHWSTFMNKIYQLTLEDIDVLQADYRLQKSPCQGLIIHSRDDNIVHFGHAEQIHALWPSSQLQLFDDLGHDRLLKNDKVIHAVRTFFTQPKRLPSDQTAHGR